MKIHGIVSPVPFPWVISGYDCLCDYVTDVTGHILLVLLISLDTFSQRERADLLHLNIFKEFFFVFSQKIVLKEDLMTFESFKYKLMYSYKNL